MAVAHRDVPARGARRRAEPRIDRVALRFALSVPGVQTAIVGTQNPARWAENARLLESGSLSEEEFAQIRERWEEVAPKTWIGQT